MIPKLPIDFNSNSAFETLKFIEEHYEELMLAYKNIMEHLRIPVVTEGGESLHEVVSVTNPNPLYITFRFIASAPVSLSAYLYYGTTNMTVDSNYIKDLLGASSNYCMPDGIYDYQVRLFENGVEVDYNEIDVHYSDYASSWEPYTLKLYRVERYSDNPAEDLGDFVTAYRTLTDSAEATTKPTSDEIFRALNVDDYLVSKTDTPYTYAVDTQEYNNIPYVIKGGTYSTGWIGKTENRLFLPNGSCSVAQLGNHYYIDIYVGIGNNWGDQVVIFNAYIKDVTDDPTPHTFNYLVSKDKIDNRR